LVVAKVRERLETRKQAVTKLDMENKKSQEVK
jgi:hypothetical protein